MRRMKRRSLLHLTLLLLTFFIVACGGSDAPEAPHVSLSHASDAQAAAVGAMLAHGAQARDVMALSSEDHKRGTWVAASLSGPGLEGAPVAVWLVSGPPDTPGLVLAASAYAREFSVAPDIRDTDAWAAPMLRTVSAVRSAASVRPDQK